MTGEVLAQPASARSRMAYAALSLAGRDKATGQNAAAGLGVSRALDGRPTRVAGVEREMPKHLVVRLFPFRPRCASRLNENLSWRRRRLTVAGTEQSPRGRLLPSAGRLRRAMDEDGGKVKRLGQKRALRRLAAALAEVIPPPHGGKTTGIYRAIKNPVPAYAARPRDRDEEISRHTFHFRSCRRPAALIQWAT